MVWKRIDLFLRNRFQGKALESGFLLSAGCPENRGKKEQETINQTKKE